MGGDEADKELEEKELEKATEPPGEPEVKEAESTADEPPKGEPPAHEEREDA